MDIPIPGSDTPPRALRSLPLPYPYRIGMALACLAAIISLTAGGAAADTSLQWRRGSTPSTRTSLPQKNQRHHDDTVRQAAYDDDSEGGPSFRGSSAGSARLRSVIVRPSGRHGAVRSAQLPNENGDRYEEESSTPFDESLDADMPEVESMPFPDEDEDARVDEPEYRPGDQPPRTFHNSMDEDAVPADGDDAAGLAQERNKAQSLCSDELARLKASRLHELSLSIIIAGTEGEDFPFECSIDDGTWYAGRCWCQSTYMWKASALCHKPLYFEDEALERYGHSWGPYRDPIVSGAHFFCRLPVLPYCMGVEPPLECTYALGHYRPGSCAPYMIDPVPLSPRGALFQAGAVVGAAAAIP